MKHFVPQSPQPNLGSLFQHDVFRYGGLTKSCAAIYFYLLSQSMTIDELAEQTGRHKKTVQRSLAKMSKITDSLTGEVFQMVRKEGKVWHACPVDLDFMAEVLGTSGKAERQKQQHEKQRVSFKRALLIQKQRKS